MSSFVIAFLLRNNRLLISWLKSPSAVILEPKKRKPVTTSSTTFSPYICHEVTELDAMISAIFFFLILGFKLALSLSSFTIIKRLFSSSPLSTIRVMLSAYLSLLMFLPLILIPACNSFSPAFLMMCSVYRFNKQGDRRQLCRIPFSILNQSVVPSRVLTATSWRAYRFLRKQVRWSGIP